jgi:hypothetical protein
MTTSKQVVQMFIDFFSTRKLKYFYDEESNVFKTGARMDGVIGNLNIFIRIKDTHYTVTVIYGFNADEASLQRVGEFLHRANYGLKNGNFEIDFDDGEIGYKTFVDFEDGVLSTEILKDSILFPIFIMNKYGKNLAKLLVSDESPKSLIEEIEKDEEDDIDTDENLEANKLPQTNGD